MKAKFLSSFFLIVVLAQFLLVDHHYTMAMWNGGEYSKHSYSQQKDADSVLEQVFASYQATQQMRILDIGCGDGKITLKIANHFKGSKVTGIDFSKSMIEYAINTQLALASGNLSFHQAAAEDFKEEGSFDLIFSFHVLHWVKAQSDALKNIYSHLAPGGKAYFILAPSKDGLPFASALKEVVEKNAADFKDFQNTQYFYDLESYRKLLVEAGFQILGLHYIYVQKEYASPESLSSWIRQWLPHVKHLNSQQKQDVFMQELVDTYLKQTGLSKKMQSIPWGEYVMSIEVTRLK